MIQSSEQQTDGGGYGMYLYHRNSSVKKVLLVDMNCSKKELKFLCEINTS